MSHKMLRPFIVKVSVLGYFPILTFRLPRCFLQRILIYMIYISKSLSSVFSNAVLTILLDQKTIIFE